MSSLCVTELCCSISYVTASCIVHNVGELSSLPSPCITLVMSCLWQSVVDEQWARAMEYVNSVSELNYMTQIVIMLYEDPTKVLVDLSRSFCEIAVCLCEDITKVSVEYLSQGCVCVV